MADEFTLALGDVRPSQLYLDADRLRRVLEWFDFEDPHLAPLPVLPHPDATAWYLTDGHTRAFVASLAGVDEISVRRAPEESELSRDVYRRCLEWCRAEEVLRIDDLHGRVLSREQFLDQWVRRCRSLPAHPGDPADLPE